MPNLSSPNARSSNYSGFLIFLALLLITAGTAYLFSGRIWFPAPTSSYAREIDRQFQIAFRVLGSLFIAGQFFLGVVLLRSRKASSARGSRPLEIAWALLIASLFFWFNVASNRLWSQIKLHDPEEDALHVEVTGTQFQWYFRYPGPDGQFGRTNPQRFSKPEEGNPLGIDPEDHDGQDDIVSTSLVLPANHDVDLILRANDVIHGLFIPAMRFKQDAVPGMTTHARFKPLQTGTYELACSQLCGLGHYRMRASVEIVTGEKFNEWLKSAH